jgi:hypothetical protein
MIEVRLPIEQWQQVLAILAQAPWAAANPLIMGIGEQLRAAAAPPDHRRDRGDGVDAEAAPHDPR